MKEITIDAKGKSMGRVASQAAAILRGKSTAEFAPNKAPQIKLTVINLKDVKVTGKKMKKKMYGKRSEYLGSYKEEAMDKIIAKKGIGYVFKIAVNGMISRTRLKKPMLKNLTVKE